MRLPRKLCLLAMTEGLLAFKAIICYSQCMQKKTNGALWVSHSSMSDFLACPRSYYLKHIYRNEKTKNKITIINPPLALGQTVHLVLEALSLLRSEDRLKEPLIEKYNEAWKNITGELGGFRDEEEELIYKNRGAIMINRVMFHPGPIINKAVKLVSPDQLPPRYYLSEKDDILLCGKIDWLEYLPSDNSVHVIDFKTGNNEEKAESLQLPIYALLVKNCQNRYVSKISYWYLEKDNEPREMKFPDLEEAHNMILAIALRIKEARLSNSFACAKNGCFACKPLEQVVEGKAKFIGTSDYQDIYILPLTEKTDDYVKEDVEPF